MQTFTYKIETLVNAGPGSEDRLEQLVRESLEDNAVRVVGAPVAYRISG